jgi:hypothetical protein
MTQTAIDIPAPGKPTAAETAREKRFDWPLCYEAENFVRDQIQAFSERNAFARTLAARMTAETGTLMLDWVDHLVVPTRCEPTLRPLGFTEDPLGDAGPNQRVFWHPEALLPRVVVDSSVQDAPFPPVLALRVDRVSDFLVVHGTTAAIEGEPLTRFRRAVVAVENQARLEVVERRGYRGYLTELPKPGQVEALLKAHELWKTRQRTFANDAEGFRAMHQVLDQVIALLGCDLACHVVFSEERDYWERRNRAARIQKRRQDRLGLGWANHDHHTFRSSREHFVELMRAWEKLGFERRERYYAGAQAGWGAQILEQPVEGIVTFCDVDLAPEETEVDFSRHPLPASPGLGTIGLWVGLHGESVLDAGMHHLECRFDYALLREQLAQEGVNTMKPFSDFEFLKQAFTEGERWPVRRERAERLRAAGSITQAQFDQFIRDGALGSHLENLQRKGGFKGFNQNAVSVIIEATDPRKHGGSK